MKKRIGIWALLLLLMMALAMPGQAGYTKPGGGMSPGWVDSRISAAMADVTGGAWPAYWVGVSTGCDTLAEAVARFSAGGAQAGEGCTLFFKANQTITADLTIPVNVILAPQNGAIITVNASYTVTCNGKVQDPGPVQWITDSAVAADVTKGFKFARGAVEQVRPEWWGGKADAATGSAAANDAAFVAAVNCGVPPAAGKYTRPKIVLAEGVYVISQTLTIKRGTVIIGNGPGNEYSASAIYAKSASSMTAIIQDAESGSESYKYGRLENFRIVGTDQGAACVGVKLDYSQGIMLRGVFFYGGNNYDADWALAATTQVHIRDCRVQNWSNGFSLPTDSSVTGCDVAVTGKNTGWSEVNPYYALYVKGNYVRISGNKVYSDGAAAKANITVIGCYIYPGYSPDIHNNIFDHNCIGLAFGNDSTSAIGGNITGNYITDNRADGVKFLSGARVYHLLFAHNRIYSNGSATRAGYGINIASSDYSGDNHFIGNIIRANYTGTIAVPDAAITIASLFSHWKWESNMLKSYDGTVEYFGDFIMGNSAAALSVGDWVYLSSTGYAKADADDAGKYPAVGRVFTAASGATKVTLVATRGRWRDDSIGALTKGGLIYLDDTTAGGQTQTAPSDAGDKVQILGLALETKEILIQPQLYYATAVAP